jgi:MYXO-CTERM domain-containing protein
MLALAKAIAIICAILAAPIAYVAFSHSNNGNHYGQEKNGNNGHQVHGAPGPIAGAGAVGLLAAAGLVWWRRRRRVQ